MPQFPTEVRSRAIGGSGLGIFAGTIDDWADENTKTQGDRWYGSPGLIGEGQKMLADPHCRRARDAVADSICSAVWEFEDGEPEVVDFCRHAFFERAPWAEWVGGVVRGYVRDGFAIREITDDVRPVSRDRFPTLGGKAVIITGMHDRPAWSVIRWGQSKLDPAKLEWVEQQLQGSDVESATTIKIPADRLLRFTWEQESANFEGYPIFRSAWGPWMAKRLLMRVELMSHEKNHLAQPFITLPTGADAATAEDEITKLATAMAQFRAHENGYYFLPGGYSVDFKSGTANTPIQQTIDRLNFDIAHAVAAGFMLLGSKGTAGSYALAQTQSGQFELSLNKHARFIENVFNAGQDGWSPVERLVRLNFGLDTVVPRLVARNMPTVDFLKVLPVLTQAKLAGLIKADETTEDFIRRVTHAPKRGVTEQYDNRLFVSPPADEAQALKFAEMEKRTQLAIEQGEALQDENSSE